MKVIITKQNIIQNLKDNQSSDNILYSTFNLISETRKFNSTVYVF
jgi:hypothetical protein